MVPLNFAYYKGKIYFHCVKEGKKLEYISNNPRVCFEVSSFLGIKKDEKPCQFGTYYRSVIAFGEACIIEKAEERTEALQKLLEKYVKGNVKPVFDERELERVAIVEVSFKKITGKQCIP